MLRVEFYFIGCPGIFLGELPVSYPTWLYHCYGLPTTHYGACRLFSRCRTRYMCVC